MRICRKLSVCAAAVALTASGTLAAAASSSGIYLSTWGTAHVAFGDGFKAWLAQSGASVAADAPVALDAGGGGFTLPASAGSGDHLDLQGRMVYPGGLTVTVPAAGSAAQAVLRFGPLRMRVLPEVDWTADLSVDGRAVPGGIRLATAAEPEVLAGGGSPSPTGFRPALVPFHLAPQTADLLAHETGRPGPAAGSLFGTLVPQFDHVPYGG